MMPPIVFGLARHSTTALVNAAILAALTAINVAIVLGISGFRADPGQFEFAVLTATGLSFFEYLAVYRGLMPPKPPPPEVIQ